MAEAGTLRYTGMPARSDPAEFAAIDETAEAGWLVRAGRQACLHAVTHPGR
jgi:hypothetical protein